MPQVTSKDGTSIAYDRFGAGPAVILVGGGLVDRSENGPLAPVLAEHFTVYNYDRRGRGDSGDTLPYALEREFEDIVAVIERAGGTAHLYGVSSGGALALEAAAAGLPLAKVAAYEVPYDVSEGAEKRWHEYVQQLTALLAEDRHEDALRLFMRLAGAPEEAVEQAHNSPMWQGSVAVAPTLAYDAACLGDLRPPTDRLRTITQPVLIANGGPTDETMAGLGASFFDDATTAIVDAVPHAERATIPQQGHVADPRAVTPVLREFFNA
ncbi:alpha/beta fold hydrolase [Luteipulveratus mongoliensis]|uniref:Hydrolase n=1 Tax=Luteipulveratus mongoliensis TaxID=571913 RepID=A0A0K1JRT3_9MICO|nr:alpha/beta hydrolase [Luteipulveratus mongoliensis]AKU19288.1 hydrolase [Luteipulveratus mongoliensis]